MGNTNNQTIFQMPNIVNDLVRQATGTDNVQNINMDFVTVAQNKVLFEEVFSGDIISIDTPRSTQVQKLLVNIEPVQSGTGNPSPDNVRPITGWTGCNVSKTGKNLLPSGIYKPSGSNNVFFGGATSIREKSISLKAGTYTLSVGVSDETNTNLYLLDLSTNQNISGFPAYGVTKKTFTLDKDGDFCVYAYKTNYATVDNPITYAQIELGSTATDYEEYNGTNYSISWQTEAGTVYGGALDIVAGVLKVTHQIVQYTGSGIVYDTSVTNPRFYFSASGLDRSEYYDYSDLSNIYSNSSSPITATGTADNVFCFYGQRVYLRDSRFTSANDFNTYATQMENNGTPITFIGHLITPATYQLTPVQVATLVGQSYFYANTGSIEELMYYSMGEVV